jgi:hypothetical protein
VGGAIIRALIGHEIKLPPEMLSRFPELGAARWRRGGVPVHVAGWFLGQRAVAAITLWHVVFLGRRTVLSAELLLHELRHVHQFGERLAFPVLYLWESVRRGYFDNRYEADARAYAARRLRESA